MSSATDDDVERYPCPMCGKSIPVAARKCRFCGEDIKPKKKKSADGTHGLIPYKNPPALIAYYLGLFSLLPCFPLGIAAFILGIIGLKNVKKNPEVSGTVHAWIGIIMGGFFGALWTLITLLGVIVPMIAR